MPSSAPALRLNPFSLYGLIGFAAAAAVHLGSYVGSALTPEHPLFWALHVGIFPLFFAFMFRLRHWQLTKRGLLGIPTSSLQWRPMLRYFPAWVPRLVVVLFVYTGINFFSAMSHLQTGARVAAGIAMSSEQGVYTLRAFSGHWLLFYLLPALFFSFVPADARPQAETEEKAVA